MSETTRTAPRWTPWRTIAAFGFVSLAGDLVYEGMRSVSGPLLAGLGASALVVGLVTGAGEAAALALRLAVGPWADRTGRHWGFAITGYAMTAVSVPLLAVTPFVGAAGLALASTLIILERTGKAVRSPSKSALLAHAAGAVGRGKGFGVHKLLDQFGAVGGPLLIAGVAALTGALWPGLALLAIPGAIAVGLLVWTRSNVRDPSVFDRAPAAAAGGAEAPVVADATKLPLDFWLFAAACGLATAGLMTYGVISFHLVDASLVSAAAVPLVYAGAMVVVAMGAVGTGFAYDRWHSRVLYLLPVLVAAAVALVFTRSIVLVLVGVAAWAAATGVQDSTVKALVADLVPSRRLATAYGLFAAVQGGAAFAGAAWAGALYEHHIGVLVGVLVAAQVAATVLLVRVLRPSA